MKRKCLEVALRLYAMFGGRTVTSPGSVVRKILVIRNNDLGDVLVATPLFEALSRLPSAPEVHAAVGPWSRPLLEHNPFITQIHSLPAPWHNKFATAGIPHNTVAGFLRSWRFIHKDPSVAQLRGYGFDTAIDVLGSPEGGLLMLRLGIPQRLSTAGYAGGHSTASLTVPYRDDLYVGDASLRFATLLGLPQDLLPQAKPQIHLTPNERADAENIWRSTSADAGLAFSQRCVLAFSGGGPEKCWPLSHHKALLEELGKMPNPPHVVLVGSSADRDSGAFLAANLPHVTDLTASVSLRQVMAITATAGRVICHPSMMMHAAAAFQKPVLVLLGPGMPDVDHHAKLWICNSRAISLAMPTVEAALCHFAAQEIPGR